jgi:myo-inositol-1(or 4)-monophosphatase
LQGFKASSEHNLVKESILEAGKLALKWFKKDPEQWKKEDGSLVSKADIEINDLLNKLLKNKNPEFGWLSEENEDDKSRLNKKITFVVDPLDGTKAFLEGKKEFSISVAIVKNGLPISGIVFSPSTGEMFEAEKNKGSWKNNKKVIISNYNRLEKCKMIAFKPMFSHPAWKEPWPKMDVENRNSIAYRMALVASGQYDAMMALNSKNDWDIAAGDLLISEAGGIVTLHTNKKIIYNIENTKKPSVIGTNKAIHEKIIKRVKILEL